MPTGHESPIGARKLNCGYWRVKTVTGWQFEHRMVMGAMLGRVLLPKETVHHKDGTKTNNKPDNLELLTRATHIGHHNQHRPKKREQVSCLTCDKNFLSYRTEGKLRSYCSRKCYRRSPIMKAENVAKASSGGLASAKKRWGYVPKRGRAK